MRWLGLAALVGGIIVYSAACSSSADGEGAYECDEALQTNTIEASDWVRQHTEISAYHYESDPEGDVIEMQLLDRSGSELGKLTVEGFFGMPSGDLDGEMSPGEQDIVEARFEPADDSEVLEVTSDAIVSNAAANEFRTRTLMERGEERVIVRSDFKAKECYASAPPKEGAESHPCAWPAPVFNMGYAVPTCGFDVNPSMGAAPNLRALEYRTPGRAASGVGGFLSYHEGMEATLDVMSGGRIQADESTVGQWLEETGVDGIIGTEVEQLFSAAYADPRWMDHVESHAAACEGQGGEGGTDDLAQVQQSRFHQGFNCESDAGMWQYSALGVELETVRQAGGAECDEDCADACGKPHLRTWDGSSFPFHAAGEFILTTAEMGAPYEIQARMEPADDLTCRDDVEACQQVTVITAVAMKVGDARVAIYRDRSPHLYVDGEPVEAADAEALSALPEGGVIHYGSSGRYRIDWPGVEALEVAVRGPYLDLKGILRPERFGQIAGIWGQYTNISGDDFRMRDGEVLEKPFDFDEFYGEFANSWRVGEEESLFDYEEGQGTEDYQMPGLPEVEVSIEDLPEELRHEAEAACSRVSGHPDRNWCIFNVACMCDEELAESLEGLSIHKSLTDAHPVAPVTISGDLCLERPASFEHREAEERSCPPKADPCVHVVRERLGVELSQDLSVDATEVGTYATEEDLQEGVIEAGTKVDSYLIHANEVAEGTGLLRGEALCAEEILGIIATNEGLEDSDGVVGLADGDYDEGDRAPTFSGDEFEILESGSGTRVGFDAEGGITEIRVITKAAGD